MYIVPNVTMKGMMSAFAIRAPFIAPHNPPTIRGTRIAPATVKGLGSILAIEAVNTPVRAKIDPTERSIPPEMMTMVIPKAIIPLMDICLNTFRRLTLVRKTGENIEKKITKTRRPI
jgi:hypothetical protein